LSLFCIYSYTIERAVLYRVILLTLTNHLQIAKHFTRYILIFYPSQFFYWNIILSNIHSDFGMLSTPSGFIVTQSKFDLKSRTPRPQSYNFKMFFRTIILCGWTCSMDPVWKEPSYVVILKTISWDCYGFQNILIFMFGWKCQIVFLIDLHNSNTIFSGNNYVHSPQYWYCAASDGFAD